jgi:hypothetical protein
MAGVDRGNALQLADAILDKCVQTFLTAASAIAFVFSRQGAEWLFHHIPKRPGQIADAASVECHGTMLRLPDQQDSLHELRFLAFMSFMSKSRGPVLQRALTAESGTFVRRCEVRGSLR